MSINPLEVDLLDEVWRNGERVGVVVKIDRGREASIAVCTEGVPVFDPATSLTIQCATAGRDGYTVKQVP